MKLSVKHVSLVIIFLTITIFSKLFFSTRLEWAGFSPIIAVSLFSGLMIEKKSYTFLLPLLSLIASDSIIQLLYIAKLFPYPGFYSYQLMNYGLLLLSVFIGWMIKAKNYQSLFAGSLLAPTVFFFISNFSVWAAPSETFYPKTFSGLIECLTAGLPFYLHSILATMVFLPAFVLCYNFLFTNTKTILFKGQTQ